MVRRVWVGWTKDRMSLPRERKKDVAVGFLLSRCQGLRRRHHHHLPFKLEPGSLNWIDVAVVAVVVAAAAVAVRLSSLLRVLTWLWFLMLL